MNLRMIVRRFYLVNIQPVPEYACVVRDPLTRNCADLVEFAEDPVTQFVTQSYQFPCSIAQE